MAKATLTPARQTPDQAAALMRAAIEPLTGLAIEIGMELERTPGFEKARVTREVQGLACDGDRARKDFDREPHSPKHHDQLRVATAALTKFTRGLITEFTKQPGYGGAFSMRRFRRWSREAEYATRSYDQAMSKRRDTRADNGALVLSRKNQLTGEPVELWDAEHEDSMFDASGGRWVTYCVAHKTLCNHRTKALAKAAMQVPEWCEACMSRVEELTGDR